MSTECLSFRNCTASELYELFGGDTVFYPENDFIYSEPYCDWDGKKCHDILGRKSWPKNRNNKSVPRKLLPFEYLDTDAYVYSTYDRRFAQYDKQYFIAQNDEGAIVAVVCHAFGGMESTHILKTAHRHGVIPNSLRYMNYTTVHTDYPVEYGTRTLKALMSYLGKGSILCSSWISKNEHPQVTPLVKDDDIHFVMARARESSLYPGEFIRVSWSGDDWKRFDKERPNYWAVDYQYDPEIPKTI